MKKFTFVKNSTTNLLTYDFNSHVASNIQPQVVVTSLQPLSGNVIVRDSSEISHLLAIHLKDAIRVYELNKSQK